MITNSEVMFDIPKTLDEFRKVMVTVLWAAEHFELYAEDLEELSIEQLLELPLANDYKKWEIHRAEVIKDFEKKTEENYHIAKCIAKLEAAWIEFGMAVCVLDACEEFTEIRYCQRKLFSALMYVSIYNETKNLKDGSAE